MKRMWFVSVMIIWKSICIIFILNGCVHHTKLKAVTVEEFSKFVSLTGYLTDAEKYGWSIVQETVFDYKMVYGATWKVPNGVDTAAYNLPVTQVSYNDALAYCKWANVKLPTYHEYWDYAQSDQREIISNLNKIYPVAKANIVGNTWDITRTENAKGEIRLAGGFLLM